MTSIDLTILAKNDANQKKAEALKGRLQGKTYMRFNVTIAPFEGNLIVSVATARPNTSKLELGELVIMVMADELMGFDTSNVQDDDEAPTGLDTIPWTEELLGPSEFVIHGEAKGNPQYFQITETRHGEFRLWNVERLETICIEPTLAEAKDAAELYKQTNL
ncbi:MAG: hypothetical protein GWN87_24960 [Desulfuromonadales bacterium]|nr:hypothetical protein [Desulfuromonadales bacterium]